VQTATVWIDAELETEIRTIVVREDLFGLVLKDGELDLGRFRRVRIQVADQLFAPRIRRVSDW